MDKALPALEKAYGIDAGPIGTEARLLAGKVLTKLERFDEAKSVLEVASTSEAGGARAFVGLAHANLKAGDKSAALAAFTQAQEKNPHFAKALAGKLRRNVDNPALAQPGSKDEAVLYVQTYGDAWTDEDKALVESYQSGAPLEAAAPIASGSTDSDAATATSEA